LGGAMMWLGQRPSRQGGRGWRVLPKPRCGLTLLTVMRFPPRTNPTESAGCRIGRPPPIREHSPAAESCERSPPNRHGASRQLATPRVAHAGASRWSSPGHPARKNRAEGNVVETFRTRASQRKQRRLLVAKLG
jgi:hypothetical protein